MEYPHHVTQRGNYRHPVFNHREDYKVYLQWLKEYSQKYSLKIWAYCLMSNHVHFICVPMTDDSLARTFNTLHMRYSQYYNRKRNLTGHLWQGRFYSCILNERHLFSAIRYVENNPVRAGIVEKAHEYKWSSANAHVIGTANSILANDCYLVKEIGNWKRYLMEGLKDPLIKNIRENTKSGRPCGDKGFIHKIEKLLGRDLRTFPRGRPRRGK